MSISVSSLKVPQGGTRVIRETVSSPQGTIEIYEPTIKDVNDIIDLQRESNFDFTESVVNFDGVTVLKRLFPMLTNIKTDDLTDEELSEIIENPSVHLLMVQNIVSQIVSEANKLFSEKLKADLASAESMLAQTELIESIPSIINEHAKRDDNVREMVEKIEDKTKEVEDAIEKAVMREVEAEIKAETNDKV